MYSAGTTERISMTRSRRSQRGAGKLKAIVFTVILILAIYMAFKIVPAYVSEYQLQDKMQELARFSVVNRYSAEQVRDNVYKAVQELDIPAKRDDIKVTASQEVVKISLDYTVPINTIFYNTELHFSPSSENKALF